MGQGSAVQQPAWPHQWWLVKVVAADQRLEETSNGWLWKSTGNVILLLKCTKKSVVLVPCSRFTESPRFTLWTNNHWKTCERAELLFYLLHLKWACFFLPLLHLFIRPSISNNLYKPILAAPTISYSPSTTLSHPFYAVFFPMHWKNEPGQDRMKQKQGRKMENGLRRASNWE